MYDVYQKSKILLFDVETLPFGARKIELQVWLLFHYFNSILERLFADAAGLDETFYIELQRRKLNLPSLGYIEENIFILEVNINF